MAKFKQPMNRHLILAKEWLTKAEQSFNKESNVRGELDLFLAQAELEQAKKASRVCRLSSEYPALKQGMAVTVALVIFSFGLGISYWLGNNLAPSGPLMIFDKSRNFSSSQPEIRQEKYFHGDNSSLLNSSYPPYSPLQTITLPINSNVDNFSSEQPESTGNTSKNPDLTKSSITSTTHTPANPAPEQKPALKPETSFSAQTVPVSKDEMKKLIKSAGQSLRNPE